ncbi:MAG: KH domain-containing protein, partial [Pontimonas sp.]
TVSVVDTPRGDLIEVRVHPDDLGRVIGRQGRTAKALRTVINALAGGRKVRVDVVDTDS